MRPVRAHLRVERDATLPTSRAFIDGILELEATDDDHEPITSFEVGVQSCCQKTSALVLDDASVLVLDGQGQQKWLPAASRPSSGASTLLNRCGMSRSCLG